MSNKRSDYAKELADRKPMIDARSLGAVTGFPTLDTLIGDAAPMPEIVVTPMQLYCPVCNGRHIDAPNEAIGWTNPPHKTHLCSFCGHLWRPHPFHTEGVTGEAWVAFMQSLTDDDFREALTMANEMVNNPDMKLKQSIAMLEADHFVRIGYQLPLYARFMAEPTDQVDHLRLWVIAKNGELVQGDSIPWPTFIRTLFEVMGLEKPRIERIMQELQR